MSFQPINFVQNCCPDGPQSNDLLRPVFMGCATKNAKVVAMSLGSLQRLISLKAVPRSAVPRLVATMNDAMSQGVDIQLRILQTLVSLVPNFPDIHSDLLGEVICFLAPNERNQPLIITRLSCYASSFKNHESQSCRQLQRLPFDSSSCS